MGWLDQYFLSCHEEVTFGIDLSVGSSDVDCFSLFEEGLELLVLSVDGAGLVSKDVLVGPV